MIPPIIHRIWLGSSLPDWVKVIYQSWEEAYPQFVHSLWTEDKLFPLVNQTTYDNAHKLVQHATPGSVWQLRSDLARYEILHRYGGLYVDTDLELLKPLGKLLSGEFLIGWEIQGQALGNTIMGCGPNHDFTYALIEGIPLSVSVNAGRAPTAISGPRYMTQVWHRVRPRFPVQPQRAFYPYGHSDAHRKPRTGNEAQQYPDSYAVHYWVNQRTKKGASL